MDSSSKKDENFMKSIKWTIHPRRMEEHSDMTDVFSTKLIKKDENFMKSIKWTVHPRRVKIL